MKIKFKEDCGFSIVESVDKKDNVTEVDETFSKDEVIEGDIIDDQGDYVSFQFGDGSMIFGLKKSLFETIEE